MANTQDSLKLLYLVKELGEYATVPDGAIVNIGGVQGPNFTIGGKGVLFADGSVSDGSDTNFVSPDFQSVYNFTSGEAFIQFTHDKDFVLQALNNNQFRFDADTGNVTISGNLTVQGSTSTVITASVNTDRVAIHQTAGNYIPFIIEPLGGITPTVNLVDIKTARGGASVFTISPTGTTFINTLSVGLINGIDLTALNNSLTSHLSTTGIKHRASQISVDQSNPTVQGSTVQEVIDNLSSKVYSISAGTARGVEYLQVQASATWTIVHSQNTRKVQLTVWDLNDEVMFADSIKITNTNTVTVKFNTPVTGRAILMLF